MALDNLIDGVTYFAQRTKINEAIDHVNLFVSTGGGDVDTNTAIGEDALSANTTGSNNTALGFEAGDNITSGSSNIAIGSGVEMDDGYTDGLSPTLSDQLNIGNWIKRNSDGTTGIAGGLFMISNSAQSGTVRQFSYIATLDANETVSLFKNGSNYDDIHFQLCIRAYHSGRTYSYNIGTVGGYGLVNDVTHEGAVTLTHLADGAGYGILEVHNGATVAADVHVTGFLTTSVNVVVTNGNLAQGI